MEDSHHDDSEHHRNTPAARGQPQRTPFDLAEIELHPGHEQRGGHAEGVHHRKETVEMDEIQDVRADHHAKQDLEHHDRHAQADRNPASSGAATAASISQNTG